jgi:murein DD-endopeptidase MepM/ murein hydrolase activator NlpD
VKPGGLQQFAHQLSSREPPAPQLTRSDLRPSYPMDGNSPSYPRHLPPPTPSRTPHRNGFDPLERAPTWAPEQTPRERAAARPVSPPPPVVERTWDDERAARARSGARQNALEEWSESFWSYLGYPISPEEKLRRQEARELEAQGRQPWYFGPRDPLPDAPYKDRAAWPVKPNPGETDVVVTSPWGPRRLPSGSREFHPGTDFRNKKGRPAFSPMNGTVLLIEQNATGGGSQIFILNDDGSIVGFAHTGALEGLQEGDEVYAGQLVGISDGSGGAPGKPPEPHAHLSYYPPGTPVDPRTRKPLQGPNPHDQNVVVRTQANPEDGLRLSRPPRRLNPEGYTGKTPMHVKR